jgi:two-component system, OmpR family, sensor histidine kinase KdpD
MRAREYLICFSAVIICTAISVPLRLSVPVTNFAMFYLLGVITVSTRCRRSIAVLNAVLSVTAFYYFCVPVHNSFVLEDWSYIVPTIAMLVVALVISTQTFRIRAQAEKAAHAELEIQTERMRNALLSAVSHDIKTPLASIYGAATSLLVEEDRFSPADRREMVESIAEEAERLNRVVSNLLDMTRLDAGFEPRKAWHPLEDIIGAALNRLDKSLKDWTVSTSLPPQLPLIFADDVLLEEVFVNLLENAVKYTVQGTTIDIIASTHNENIAVIIRDSGPGFPAGEEARLFQKFFRGKGNNVRGAGLGLAICKSIIHAHRGSIIAENRSEGGAVVRIELPIGAMPPVIATVPETSLS